MVTMYSTVTAKGQITLPAQLRQKYGILPGQKVGIREIDGTIELEPVVTMAEVRAAARLEMEQAGTLGYRPEASEGWRRSAAHRFSSAH